MRKQILILFRLEHIAFSPTVLGVYDALAKEADVTIYCPRPREFKVADMGGRNSSGKGYSIKEWVNECFTQVGLKAEGYIEEQTGFVSAYQKFISVNSVIRTLGYKPGVSFKELAKMMMS